MFHYNSNSTQKQFKFENDVLYVPLFLYCIKTRKSIHFINNGKKSSNSEQTKDEANPNNNYIVQTSWTFLRFFIAYVDYANPFKVSKLSLKVNNLTFMLQKYL